MQNIERLINMHLKKENYKYMLSISLIYTSIKYLHTHYFKIISDSE